MSSNKLLANLKQDLPASIVVFLIALPLCLGIALASGAPLFSGMIAGIVGGVVIGWLSNSHTSVSGPAAGLTAVVLVSIQQLGSFQAFLLAVVMAGVFQFTLGLVRAGSIANFFPTSVIKGMLSGIGIIIILKQIPHALGYDKDAEGDMAFSEAGGSNTLTTLWDTITTFIHPGATLIALVALAMPYWPPVARLFGFEPLPVYLLFLLIGITLAYSAVNEAVKHWFFRREKL